MGRKALLTVAVTALLVLAGCAGAGTPATDGGADAGESKTITVGANGQVQAEADQAVVRVSVEATGPDAATARQRLAENVSEMRAALSELGIDDDQVVTAYYDISQRHRDPRPSEERPQPEYRAIHAFEITLSDTERVGEVIDTAVTNGATGVDNVEFTLSAETRQELRQQALAEAMTNARGQADTLASESDLAISGVHQVSTTEIGVQPYRQEVAYATADAGAGTSIDSGPVTVTAQVSVVYNASAA
jgi:uncharacterized protein YggE